MISSLLLRTLPLSLLTLATVASAQDAPPQGPPKFQFLRQNEDWSFLADSDEPRSGLDSLKYISLSEDGDIWVSIGGRLVTRFENWNNFNFGAPPGISHDDDFILTRARVHADLHVGDDVRVFGEIKTAQATDRDLPGGRRTLDFDTLDLQQAFVDWKVPGTGESPLNLRIGRQMMSFGANRLVSPLPWGNALRAWDGITASQTHGAWDVTALATAFVPVDRTDLNEADTHELLYGVYAQTKTEGGGKDLYWLGNQRRTAMYNGTAGAAQRQTFGLRWYQGKNTTTDSEVEVAYQLGEVGSEDVRAWSIASQFGYRPDGGSTRYWAGVDAASGDDNPGGSVGTFDQLYPLGHAYFGYIDAIGRQNIFDTSLGATWKPAKKLSLTLGGHSFWLFSKDDAIYNAGGGIVRAPGSFDSSWIGWEVDATATWRHDQRMTTQVGVSQFYAGDALESSGPSDDATFGYIQFSYSF